MGAEELGKLPHDFSKRCWVLDPPINPARQLLPNVLVSVELVNKQDCGKILLVSDGSPNRLIDGPHADVLVILLVVGATTSRLLQDIPHTNHPYTCVRA